MEGHQPYRPPQARMAQRPTAAGTAGITPVMIENLARTRPWVLFVGVVTMIFSAFLFFAGGLVVVAGRMACGVSQLAPIGGAALGTVYLLAALLYFFPALYLLRYGISIKRIGRGSAVAVEEALRHQLSFWRFVGIFLAVVLAIYAVVLILIFTVPEFS